jgi:hypothetical protein
MQGYLYGQSAPTENCPYCGEVCEADFVDIGIGYTQCGPYYCQNCGASEIGPYDPPRPTNGFERKDGWYAPGEPLSDLANTLNGKPVSHKEAKTLYDVGLLDEWGPKRIPLRSHGKPDAELEPCDGLPQPADLF